MQKIIRYEISKTEQNCGVLLRFGYIFLRQPSTK